MLCNARQYDIIPTRAVFIFFSIIPIWRLYYPNIIRIWKALVGT